VTSSISDVTKWLVQKKVSVYNDAFAILVPVSELKFVQSARRNLLAPVLIAFLVLGIAIALMLRYTPHSTAEITVLRTAIHPTHTVFKADTMMVGRERSQDDLYVVMDIRIEDRLNLPIFLKDVTGILTTSEGESITTSAVEKQEFDNLYTAFPALKPLASQPLLRDTLVAPGRSAEGMVILHFPVTQDAWSRRRSAVLRVDLYHQGPISITIPQNDHVSSTKVPNSAIEQE
jgi:hypothetical protein